MKRQHTRFVCAFFCMFLLAACAVSGKPPVSPKAPAAVSDGEPFLGVGYAPITDFKTLPVPESITGGLRIVQIVPQSAAHLAGLRVGDIIVAYDTQKITRATGSSFSDSFRDYIKTRKKIGEVLTLEIIRKETRMDAAQDNRKTSLPSMDAIRDMIQAMPYGHHARISIRKQVVMKTVDVILASKPGITSEQLPTNEQLYPQLEAIYDPYCDLSLKLVQDLHLENTYQAILDRFSENEQWDDSFRLTLFRYIHRDPLRAGIAAEQTCDALEKTVRSRSISDLLQTAAGILDESISIHTDPLPAPPQIGSPLLLHIRFIREITTLALQYRNQAVKDLSEKERRFLAENLHLALADSEGMTPSMEEFEARAEEPLQEITAIAHKIDYPALIASGILLARLADEQWLLDLQALLETLPADKSNTFPGVKGSILYVADTPAGPLIIGGKGANRYAIASGIIIDLGGDDIYLSDPGGTPREGVSLVIDFNGDDQYSATDPVSLGCGFLGSALLIDLSGDDTYAGTSFSQGCGIMGVGVLADHQGNDRYILQEYGQGTGIWGIGLLLDDDGQDIYTAGAMSQGVGGPKGVGLLSDLAGDDQYIATGRYASSYGTKGIFNGLSQGFGFGFRGIASGGVGIVLDGDGNDRFLAGNFSQGCGYAYGLGIMKNAGQGNDQYMGSRYAQGCSAHSAAGILIDDGGDDHYAGLMGALQGAAWDMGLAVLVDKSGNDTYESRNLFFSQADAAYTGLALFLDQQGTDRYYFTPGKSKAPFRNQNNLSFFIDSGGETDQYNEDTSPNNAIQIKGNQYLRIDLDQDILPALLNAHYRELIQHETAE